MHVASWILVYANFSGPIAYLVYQPGITNLFVNFINFMFFCFVFNQTISFILVEQIIKLPLTL